MRMLLLAAAVRSVVAPPTTPIDPSRYWDYVVSHLVVDEGVIRDLKRPSYSSRTGTVVAGPFTRQAIQFSASTQVRYSASLQMGGDFTIEGMAYFDSVGFSSNTNQYIFDAGTNNFVFRLYNKKWSVSSPASTAIATSTEEALPDRWYHFAVVRAEGIIKIFIDGVMVAQGALAGNLTQSTFTWGNYGGGGYGMRGRLANARITVKARYLANFPKPTADYEAGNAVEATYDPYWDNVLFQSRGGVTVPVDDKGSTVTVTGANAASILNSSIYRFGPNSYFFNGDGTRAGWPGTGNKYDLGSDDFTIEAWVRPTLTTGGTVIQTIVGQRGVSGIDQLGQFVLVIEGNKPRFYYNQVTGGWSSIAGGTGTDMLLGVWHHIAAIRCGNVIRLMVNGVQVAIAAVTSALVASTEDLRIGSTGNGTLPFNGYIDGVRITKGVPRYVLDTYPKCRSDWATRAKNVTDPENLGKDDKFGQVSFFMQFLDQDLTDVRNMLARNGGQLTGGGVDSTYPLFGKPTYTIITANGSSGATGIAWPGTRALIAAGDFTVECWVNTNYAATSASNALPLIGQYGTGGAPSWALAIHNKKLAFAYANDTFFSGTVDINDNQWHHVAAVRKNGVITLYVDGVAVGTRADTSVFGNSGYISVASNRWGSAMAGQRVSLADIRVTSGFARYAGNFARPTERMVVEGMAA